MASLMTAPDLGPCQCEPVDELRDGFGTLIDVRRSDHEHSDFEPYACAETGCDCLAHTPPGVERKPAESPAEPPERFGVTIPAGALDFSRERVTQAAAALDGILTDHPPITDPDDPDAVCGLADNLEQIWPEGLDPLDVLALTIRRLVDATSRKPRTSAAEAFEHMRRKVRR